MVLTEFDDKALKEIAFITNAKFFNAKNTEELQSVYQEIDALEKTIIKTTKNFTVFELFPYFIGIIIILILIKESMALSSLNGVRT